MTTFSALKGGVAFQVGSWKVSRCRGVSQLHCRLSRCSGPLAAQKTDTFISLVSSGNCRRSGKPNQTKKGRFASRFAKKGCFCEFGPSNKKENSQQNPPDSRITPIYVNFSCFFLQGKPTRIQKNSPFSCPTRESAFVWFPCRNDS